MPELPEVETARRIVERELIDFCRTLGGSPRQVLWRVRIPTAAAWTFAALPNAISFALIGVVLAPSKLIVGLSKRQAPNQGLKAAFSPE